MKRIVWLACLLSFWMSGATADAQKSTAKTVKGWVLDSACAFTKELSKPISRDCAIACAKQGSPLVILDNGRTIYWPISGSMPAEGQNDRLMPFAGKRVNVTGQVFARGGSHALVIKKIEEAAAGK
ncbi:MAG: hypothetical protein FJW26_16435 [Acidimicrobiia bacterium]|nr:hypothetical protein [Acidimicrobiia bacterium]